jgi:hypothetical protein
MNYNKLNSLIANINAVIGNQETKIQKKLFRLYEKVKSHHESYQAQVEELRLDNASTDDKDILLLDEKNGYKFTKESIKKLTAQVTELGNKEFDFTPIPVVNQAGLEHFTFLEDWVTGITFVKEEEEEL